MRALFLLLLCALWGGLARAQEPSRSWGEVFADLARLEDPATDPGTAAELRSRLDARAARAVGADPASAEPTRGWLLRVHLAQAAGADAGPALAELAKRSPDGLSQAETWDVVSVLPGGQARTRALLLACGETQELSSAQLRLAWQIGVEEARALRLADGALPIQRLLEERAHAAWSTMDLGLTLSRLGREKELDTLFTEAIQRERGAGRPTGELWSRWGIATLGFGHEERARDRLGRALARGSLDAALVLGRMDLRAGKREAARNGLRPSILRSPPASWAVRGWGLALLPVPRCPPPVRTGSTETPRLAGTEPQQKP